MSDLMILVGSIQFEMCYDCTVLFVATNYFGRGETADHPKCFVIPPVPIHSLFCFDSLKCALLLMLPISTNNYLHLLDRCYIFLLLPFQAVYRQTTKVCMVYMRH